jgi:hypothetical protein
MTLLEWSPSSCLILIHENASFGYLLFFTSGFQTGVTLFFFELYREIIKKSKSLNMQNQELRRPNTVRVHVQHLLSIVYLNIYILRGLVEYIYYMSSILPISVVLASDSSYFGLWITLTKWWWCQLSFWF